MTPSERQGLDTSHGRDETMHVLPVPALPVTEYERHIATPPPVASQSGRSQSPVVTPRAGGGRLRALLLGLLPWVSALVSVLAFRFFLRSWEFAVGIVALLFVHEMGHFIVFRIKKVRARWPIFIPLFGAFVMPLGTVQSAQDFAEIALAGPVVGGVGALACLLVAQSIATSSCQTTLFAGALPFDSLYCLSTNQALTWLGLATFGFFINLLNLIPINPLDGGRVVGAISRWIWPFALVASIVLGGVDLLQFQHLSIFWLTIGVAAIFGFGETVTRFRQAPQSAFYATPLPARVALAVAYLAAGVLLAYGMMISAQMFDVWRFVW